MNPRLFVGGSALLLAAMACSDDSNSPTAAVPTNPSATPEAVVTSNTWTTRANMPSDRWFIATATFPDRVGGASLYAIGGSNSPVFPWAPLGKVQVYNPATNTWTTKAQLPHVVAGHGNNGAQVIDGLIYVPGGERAFNGYRYLQVYSPKTNTWVDKAPLPVAASDGVSGAIDGKLYVPARCVEDGVYCLVRIAFQRYDPAANAWTQLPLPPADLSSGPVAGGVLNKKLYVLWAGVTQGLYVYDPATKLWAQKASMPSPRGEYAFAAVNNRLYLVGGIVVSGGTATNVGRVDVYDPATNTWTKKASIPRIEPGLSGGRVVVNGQARLEVIGGTRPGNNLQYTP